MIVSASKLQTQRSVSDLLQEKQRAAAQPSQYHISEALEAAKIADPDEDFDELDTKLSINTTHTENTEDEELEEKNGTSSGTSPNSTRGSQPIRRISLCEQDALLPPSLDLFLVREMFSCLDPQNILTLFAALFGECRIVFTSAYNYRLKAVTNSLLRLMYPFQWQHMFVPLLSRGSLDLLRTDCPFIVGVNSYLMQSINILPGVVIADLDKNVVKYKPGTFVNFPAKCKNRLYKSIVRFMSTMFILQAANNKRVSTMPTKSGSASTPATAAGTTASTPRDSINNNTNGGLPPTPNAKKPPPLLTNLDQRGSYIKHARSASDLGAPKISPPMNGVSPPSQLHSSDVDTPISDEMDMTELPPAAATATATLKSSRKAHLALKALRDGFLDVFVSLFYKYRLFFRPEDENNPFEMPLFLEHTKPQYQTLIQSFVRTRCFKSFITLRTSMRERSMRKYLFDHRVVQKIQAKWKQFAARRVEPLGDTLVFARGTSGWEKRYVVIEGETLSIYKNKKSTNAKPKFSRSLTPGTCRVVVPIIENQETYFSFELCATQKSKYAKEKESAFHFRAESEASRKAWVTLIRARVMDPELMARYEKFASS